MASTPPRREWYDAFAEPLPFIGFTCFSNRQPRPPLVEHLSPPRSRMDLGFVFVFLLLVLALFLITGLYLSFSLTAADAPPPIR